jgi:hypothetical protein
MTHEMNQISKQICEKINWALVPYFNGNASVVIKTFDKNVTQLRKESKAKEAEWGNNIIGQNGNGNWTTLVGEGLVYDVLKIRGENPRKPMKKGGYQPDWETDEYMYEVKTRNWTTTGTAGEKVLGVMYKYSDIPDLYGKPLKIVCVAFQEYELTNGPTKIFGDELSDRKKAYLELAKTQDIEYMKFSDLVASINYK